MTSDPVGEFEEAIAVFDDMRVNEDWRPAREHLADMAFKHGPAIIARLRAAEAAAPKWPAPRPIDEAKPEMGAILASPGPFWVKAQWYDDADAKKPKPFWRIDFRLGLPDARDFARKLRWFIELPPPPVSVEELRRILKAERKPEEPQP